MKIIGKEILIRDLDNNEMRIKVTDIDISTSLIGKKNISICLSDHVKKSDISLNSIVFSCSD
jgi:hypothetical protein